MNAQNLVGYDNSMYDMYVPFFNILKFIFYFGWLHVAEVLINPFGEDDEDFDVNYIINRNVQVSYLMVEGSSEDHPLEDPYQGALPTSLPHTVESYRTKPDLPISFPTDHLRETLTDQEMAFVAEDVTEEQEGGMVVIAEEGSLTGSMNSLACLRNPVLDNLERKQHRTLSLRSRIQIRTRTISASSLTSRLSINSKQ